MRLHIVLLIVIIYIVYFHTDIEISNNIEGVINELIINTKNLMQELTEKIRQMDQEEFIVTVSLEGGLADGRE